MLGSVRFPTAFVTLVAVMMLEVTAAPVHAQAWLPAKGEGTVSMVFQDTFIKYHYFTTTPLDRGHIKSESLLVDVTYGLTDKIAVSVGIPWVTAK
jgi:hypothetical protein